MKAREWNTVLPAELAEQALAVAMEVSSRLVKTENIKKSFEITAGQTSPERPTIWQSGTLSGGFPGLSAMCFQLESCRPGQGWAECGLEFMKLVSDGANYQTAHYHPDSINSLFAGLPGVGLVALWAPDGRSRYKGLLETIDSLLVENIATVISEVNAGRNSMLIRHYDIVSGLTGAGRYLLARLPDEGAEVSLKKSLEILVEKTREVSGVLQFFTASSDPYFLCAPIEGKGAINCGLAHGVPGPLALMSLCLLNGVEVPGLKESVEFLSNWLIAHSINDEQGVNWTANVIVPAENSSADLDEKSVACRAAWCYGSPGVARSLWLAGAALDKSGFQGFAVSAMEAVYRRSTEEQGLHSPTFCHGTAGLLHISARFASDTNLPIFKEAVETLTRQLLAKFDPKLFWGYKDFCNLLGYTDDHGFLTGAIGVALTLLATVYNAEPQWDQSLLLS